MLRWILRGVAVYVAVLFLWGCFLLLAVKFDAVASIERKLFKPKLAVVVNGAPYDGADVTIEGQQLVSGAHFEQEALASWTDANTWLFLLDGFPSITENQPAIDLGVNVEGIANTKPGNTVVSQKVAVVFRANPFPFALVREKIVFIDMNSLGKKFRRDCIRQYIYLYATLETAKSLPESCKLGS